MSLENINIITPQDDVTDARIGIVASRFNRFIVDRLLHGCMDHLREAGIRQKNITLVQVPGAFEIPLAAQQLLGRSEIDAVVTLGAIIRGETPHFDYIATECTRGIAEIALKNNKPVIFGVLTVDTIEQAEQRSGSEESNKGTEAARSALHMLSILRRI